MPTPDGWALAPSGWYYQRRRRDIVQRRGPIDDRDADFILTRPGEPQCPPCDFEVVRSLWEAKDDGTK